MLLRKQLTPIIIDIALVQLSQYKNAWWCL